MIEKNNLKLILLNFVFALIILFVSFPVYAEEYVAQVEGGQSYLTLQEAIDAVPDKGTINLLCEVYYPENSINLDIDKTYLINMKDHVIDGSNLNSSIFKLSSGNVTFTEGIIENANISSNGGAFLIEGSTEKANIPILTLNNVYIQNNRAKRGGAIYASTGEINSNGSHFINNTVSDLGGAICTFDPVCNIVLKDSHINENKSLRDDGIAAIYLMGNLEAEKCEFNNNYIDPIENNKVTNSSIIQIGSDYLDFFWPTIYDRFGNAVFNGCSFNENKAAYSTVLVTYNKEDVVFNNCEFINNESKYVGAINVSLDDSVVLTPAPKVGTVILKNTIIKENKATEVGPYTSGGVANVTTGGIALTSGNLNINSGAIYNNTSAKGEANDLFIYKSGTSFDILPANTMNSVNENNQEKIDFDDYAWKDLHINDDNINEEFIYDFKNDHKFTEYKLTAYQQQFIKVAQIGQKNITV